MPEASDVPEPPRPPPAGAEARRRGASDPIADAATLCEPAGVADAPTLAGDVSGTASEATGVDPGLADETFDHGGEAPRAAPALNPTVPGYEILGELGRGGMGVVYKARQVGLDRIVALKMILAGAHAGAEDLDRFRVEAEAVARLQHPNIVQIYEIGERGGLPYFSLEYVEGGSLDRRLDGTPMAPAAAARLVDQLARAVAAAHRHRIIHRDLKPANVLIAEDGTPKLTDFGLAKKLDVDEGRTRSGAIMGTPSFMAPEQAGGKHGAIGPAADIYALGAILYDLVTGRPPFKAATPLDTVLQVLSEEPVPPGRLQPGLPADMETICLKCLEKDPARRYASAQDLADELRRFLEGRPILARPIGRLARAGRMCRRNPVVAGLGAAVALLILALAVGSTASALTLKSTLDRSLKAERRARERLADSLVERAELGRLSRRSGQRFDGLANLAEAIKIRPSEEARDAVIACLALPDLKLPAPAGGSWWRAIDPDRGRVASVGPGPTVWLRDWADGRMIRQLPLPPGLATAEPHEFSPDGRYLSAFAQPGLGCLIWDVQTGRLVLHDRRGVSGWSMTFAPDSRRMALGTFAGELLVFETATGKQVAAIAGCAAPNVIRFDPAGDGLRLAVAGKSAGDRSLEIYDLATGAWTARINHPAGLDGLSWRGDGRVLATGCDDAAIYVWDVEGAPRLISRLEGHLGVGIHLAFSHDGALLASNAWDGTTRIWDAVGGFQRLLTHVSTSATLFWSRDDRVLASGTPKEILVWDADDGRDCRTLHHGRLGRRSLRSTGRTGPKGVDFSPDGRLLASVDIDGVRLWDPDRGTELAHLPDSTSPSARFCPDGTSLVTVGQSGLRRWPCRRRSADGAVVLGPPERFKILPAFDTKLSWDAKGRSLGITSGPTDEGFVLDPREEGSPVRLATQPRMDQIALSPDGRWAATSTWHPTRVRIWDARTGRPVRDLEDEGYFPTFSPDGRWLALEAGGVVKFFEAGTWKPGPSIGIGAATPLAFSPDGRLLAFVESASQLAKLYEVARGKVVATLEPPDRSGVEWFAFRPDGGQLAVATKVNTVQLWDLHSVRARLRALGLDWDPAGALPASPASAGRPPLRVLVEGIPADPRAVATKAKAQQGRGEALRRNGRLEDAIAVLRDSARLGPDDPLTHFFLGLALRGAGRLDEAISSFREAARLDDPNKAGAAIRSLGDTLRQAGRHDEAVAPFREILRLVPDDFEVRFRLGETLRDAGRPDEATAAFRELAGGLRKLVGQTPADPGRRHYLAAALMLAGDREGYRRACQGVPDRFGEAEPWTHSEAARSCLLSPDALPDFLPALAIAEAAAAREPNAIWKLYELALANLRAGRPVEAEQLASRAIARDPDWHAAALNRAVLALAHAKLGHAKEARNWLETTRRPRPPGGPPGEVMGPEAPWWDCADLLILRDEADALPAAPPAP